MRENASLLCMGIVKQKCFGNAGTDTSFNQHPTILSRESGVPIAALPVFNGLIRIGGEYKIPTSFYLFYQIIFSS
jgi:hypothetical protein